MRTIAAVLTTYNAGPLLEEALASVLAQTRPPDEILVVDDGSTDDTAARLRRFVPRVRHHAQANTGSSGARNTGWRLAASAWIAYLDADDLWLPDRLEKQEAWLAGHPETEAVFGQAQNFAQPGCEALFDPALHHLDVWLPGWSPGTALVQRAVLERTGGFNADLRSSEVVDWIIRLREAGTRMAMLETPLLRRRLHRDNKGRQAASARQANLQILRGFISRNRARAAGTNPVA